VKKSFNKLLFGLIVVSYVITTLGIPVYLHYCGGELEEVNFVLKGSSCCGDEVPPEDSDCCKDEGLVLKSNLDFTLKEFSIKKIQAPEHTLYHSNFSRLSFSVEKFVAHVFSNPVLPPLLQDEIVSTTVLRI